MMNNDDLFAAIFIGMFANFLFSMLFTVINKNVLSSFRNTCDEQFDIIDERLYTIENRVNSMKGKFKGLRRLIRNDNNKTRQRIVDAFKKEQNESMDMLLSLLFKKEWNDGNEVQDNEVQDNEVQDNEVQDNEVQDNEFQDNEVQDNEVQDNEVQDNEVQDNEVDDNEVDDNEVPRKTRKIEPNPMSFFDFDESSPFTLPKLDISWDQSDLQLDDVEE